VGDLVADPCGQAWLFEERCRDTLAIGLISDVGTGVCAERRAVSMFLVSEMRGVCTS
jgi:hypothetical protein